MVTPDEQPTDARGVTMSAPIAAWSLDGKAVDGARRWLAVTLVSISLLLVGMVGLVALEG